MTLPHHGLGQFVSSHMLHPKLSLSGTAWDLAAFSKLDACTRSEQEQSSNKSVQTAVPVFMRAGARGPIHSPHTRPVVTRWPPAARLQQVIYVALCVRAVRDQRGSFPARDAAGICVRVCLAGFTDRGFADNICPVLQHEESI